MISDEQQSVLVLLAGQLSGRKLVWALTGSASFVMQGMEMPVHDIDIQTDADSAYKIAEQLRSFIVKPVVFSSAPLIRSHFGELNIQGVKVEIMGDVQKGLPDGGWEEPVDVKSLRKNVPYLGRNFPVLPLEYECEAYRKLGRIEKAERIRQFLISSGNLNHITDKRMEERKS